MGYVECRVIKLTWVSLYFLTKSFLFNFGIFDQVILLEAWFFSLIFYDFFLISSFCMK
jgi:hypothetical protein